jgi:hypothetical protein
MSWAAVAAAVIAAAASAYNTRRVAKKQDQEIAAGIREKSKVQRRADAKVNEELQQLEKSTSKGEQQSTMSQYQQAIRGTEAQAQAGQALAGLSKEYDAATGAATQQRQGYLGDVINSLSRIDAAGLQRQREGFSAADLGTNLRVMGREGQGIDFLANMRAQGVRRNPYIDALAAGLSAYGGGAGGGASSAATSSAGSYASGLGSGIYSGLGG